MSSKIEWCTFGMYITDEIDYGDGRALKTRVIGGAGIYAMLGARLSAGTQYACQVSCIVDKGHDFPEEFQALIEKWQTSTVFRTDLSRATTRAWNGYSQNQHRDFKYLTPKRRLEVDSLSNEQALASSFHMVCSPSRCMTLVEGLRHRREGLADAKGQPVVVWEPIPDLCTPAELENLQEASKFVRVISPNGEELMDFFASGDVMVKREDMVRILLGKCGSLPEQAVVVRDGADGSRLYFQGRVVHFRAFHQDSARVIDPTGGGNAYLGALAMALTERVAPDLVATVKGLALHESSESKELMSLVLAAVHGTIAASYAIEQIGTPSLSATSNDSWNGERYEARYEEYIRREQSYILQQLLAQR